MKIIRAKSIDATDSGVIVKLSNLEALLLRNMCANVSVLNGHQSLTNAAQEMRVKFSSIYGGHNPPLCSKNYGFMPSAEQNMANTLLNLGDF